MGELIFENNDTIVFAGDSVTDMGSSNPVGIGHNDNIGTISYVRVLDNFLTVFYPEVSLRIINSGISGNRSRDLLLRFDRDVTEFKPEWVSICIGINDVWRQFDSPQMKNEHVAPDEYKSNVEEMILKAKNNVKGIFILSPYIMEPCAEDMMRKRMNEYAEICRELAEKHDCIFVDFQKMYDEYFKIHHSALIAWDRIHPNQIGAMLMAKEFLAHCDFDYGHIPNK